MTTTQPSPFAAPATAATPEEMTRARDLITKIATHPGYPIALVSELAELVPAILARHDLVLTDPRLARRS